jgi:hypothetical protein
VLPAAAADGRVEMRPERVSAARPKTLPSRASLCSCGYTEKNTSSNNTAQQQHRRVSDHQPRPTQQLLSPCIHCEKQMQEPGLTEKPGWFCKELSVKS